MRRKNGSSANGLRSRTRCVVYTLTTDGMVFFSIGASDGRAWPSTEAGSAPARVGTADRVGLAGAAWAGLSKASFRPVAARPPKAAAAVRASRVGKGRMGMGSLSCVVLGGSLRHRRGR